MIAGIVNDSLEATIPLTLERDAGDVQPIEAVIDTGFNGFLTLPPAQDCGAGTSLALSSTRIPRRWQRSGV